MSAGIKLLSSLVTSERGVEKFIHFDLSKDLFIGDELDLFEFVANHVTKFGAIPAIETIQNDCGVELDSTIEPPDYYLEQVEARYIHQELKKGINTAVDHLKEKQPEQALEFLVDAVQKLVIKRKRRELVDFAKNALKMVKDEYKKKILLGDDYGIQLGWPYLDEMIGGAQPGDVISIVGRPAQGKTFLSLFSALHTWKHSKKVPMFVSMEMKPILIIQRLAALHVGVPLTKLKHAELSTDMYKSMLKGLSDASKSDTPFWVVDGNMAATVSDIMLLARHLQPDVIFIDGAYLLQDTRKTSQAWERAKNIVEDIKHMLAGQLGVPVICSYQFNRESEKKKNDHLGVGSIAHTDAIGQISSVVLGLLEEDNIESMMEKKVQVLKGRSGEVGSFRIGWNFDKYPYMDFSQRGDKSLEKLMFL